MKRHAQGLRVLYHVLSDKSWGIISDKNIQDSDFFSDSKACLRYIKEYFAEFGEFPPIDVVEDKAKVIFPEPAAKDYCVQEFERYRMGHIIKDIMQTTNSMAMTNPQECLMQIKQKILEITPPQKNTSFKFQSEQIYNQYIEDKVQDAKGIVPAYPAMQDAFDVYENGSINAILGVVSTGKTWLSCITAMNAAFTQGKKVLLVSMENPAKSINQRLTSLYYKIPFGSLKRGLVDIRTQKNWFEGIPKISGEKGDIWVIDKVRTVGDILSAADSSSPDMVIVDGAYKLDTTFRGTAYEKSSRVLTELENMAKMLDVPVLCTSQLNKDAQTAKGGRQIAFEARFNKEWLMNPSTVCCLTQSEDEVQFNVVACTIVKARESDDFSSEPFMINQDRVKMDFSQQMAPSVDETLLSQIIG